MTMPRRRRVVAATAVVFVAAVAAVVAAAADCPVGCACKWKGGKQTVECVNKSLTAIPDGIDAGTQVLDMSGNALDALSRGRFATAGLTNLQKIYMARCRIAYVDDAAFRGLSNLVELDLSDNAIADVPTGSFEDYPQLMKLTLAGNAVTAVRTGAFRRLAYLTVLDLSRCQVSALEPGAFDGLHRLEWLRLDHNRIARIEGRPALPLSLHGIEMHHNPWTCDCRLRDVHRWLVDENSAPHTVEPTCYGPDRLRGAAIRKLALDELACAPEASAVSPAYVRTDAGKNVTLSCRVTPVGEARVTWWFEGRPVPAVTAAAAAAAATANGTTASVASVAVVVGGGGDPPELSIEDVGPADNGTYACVAENRAGRAACNFTVLVVQVPSEMAAGSYPPAVPAPTLLAVVLAAGAACFVAIAVAAVCTVGCRAKRRRHRAAGGGKSVGGRSAAADGSISTGCGDGSTGTGTGAGAGGGGYDGDGGGDGSTAGGSDGSVAVGGQTTAKTIRHSDSANLTVSSTTDGKLSSAEDVSAYGGGEYDPMASVTGTATAATYADHETLHAAGGAYDAYRTNDVCYTTTMEANPDLISDASTVVRDAAAGDVYTIPVPPPAMSGSREFWPGAPQIYHHPSSSSSSSYRLQQLSPRTLTAGEPYPADYGLPRVQAPAVVDLGYPADYGLPKVQASGSYRTLPYRRNAAKPQGRSCQEAEFVLLQQQHHHHHHHHHQQQLQQHHHHQQQQQHLLQQRQYQPPAHRYEPQNVRYNQQGYPYPTVAAAFYEPPSLSNASAQTLDEGTMTTMMMASSPPQPPPPPPQPVGGRQQQQQQQQQHKTVTSMLKQPINTESPDEGYVGEGPDS